MKRGLRRLGIGLGALVGLLLLLVVILYLVGSSKLSKTYEVQTASLTIPSDSAGIARGAHLVRTNGCVDCHTANLGGQVLADEPPFRLVASNLTRGVGGVGNLYDAQKFDRAFRHGVKHDGTTVFIMPAAAYHHMSDDDAAHIIAYLLSVPPVDNELPTRAIKPLGRILTAVGALNPTFELNLTPARSTAPAPAPTAEYGQYLTSVTCAYCHTESLRGGVTPDPASPPSADLAPVGRWSFEDFERTGMTGVTPAGKVLNPQFMPWTIIGAMDDQERRAVHAFLATLDSSPAPTASN